MKNLSHILLSCLLFFSVTGVNAGYAETSIDTIIFPFERKTFIEGNKSVSFHLRNGTTNIPYLIQGSMEYFSEATGKNAEKENKVEKLPFIITPPLFKLEPGKAYDWRILFSGNADSLPKDRESAYIVKFRAIPPKKIDTDEEVKGDNKKTDFTAIQAIHFKVYYRPKAFEKLLIEDAQKKLSFRVEGNELVVKNDSPIYMALDSFEVAGVTFEEDELFKPLIPLGEQRFKFSGNIKSGSKATWSVLDELVLDLPKETSVIQ
ncbi:MULTISPECIES: fimbrial biogenesis chaperone [Providencia]|uniref:fimbrial biogenesis chaperone n=1 Tax=Providencia TaxID=586 RepID=UPI000ED1AD73|nr:MULTISPECIES: molecular chaperone [Providencia]HCI95285.1 molecular chaperone [Providencia sp.]EJD6081264.1 molecular chaperone [Providencia rettgeri]EJD6400897.1 molecular chaperone [Providencia rettgeri]EJD6584844.1 molecular chaperone [Providencia rettgeri]EJD6601655.1 molecular chaperone [Providencia rettgeri]